MQQQTKILRVTKCILSEILKLPMSVEDREGLSVLAIDWRGFDGYIVKMRKVEEIYIAELEGRLFVPRHATQIKRFKETLVHLINWKNHLVRLAEIVDGAMAEKRSMESFEGVLQTKKRSLTPTDYTYFKIPNDAIFSILYDVLLISNIARLVDRGVIHCKIVAFHLRILLHLIHCHIQEAKVATSICEKTISRAKKMPYGKLIRYMQDK
ncbi:hypothetical protein VTP01DRAFT_4362 [Rhizomucor pusillus]|uniref:uncharacterized protein n=1 Tax=Rhizomucor pusillus TaxID=4840 RepID=UPI0037422364